MPFAILAIVGAFFDMRIPGMIVLFALGASSPLGVMAFLNVRFRHVNLERIPQLTEIPRRLVITRATLPSASVTIAFCLLFLLDRSSDGLSAHVLGIGVLAALAFWPVGNWLWRRWARSLGFEPDALLARLYRVDSIRR
jgi:hypothetical protein